MSERIVYEFTPTPRAALRAVEEGLLDQWDYLILAALYDRRMRGRSQVRFTLDELRRWIAWAKTDDALSKRLRSLRDKGWLRYEQPHKRPYRYMATLAWEPSEVGPRSEATDQARSDGGNARTGPSRSRPGPSTEDPGIAIAEPGSGAEGGGADPSTPDVQTKPSSLDEGVVPEISTRDPRAREASDGPTGDWIADAILARRMEAAAESRSRPEHEQEVVDAVLEAFPGAREIAGPPPPGRVREHVAARGVVVELVEVSPEPAT